MQIIPKNTSKNVPVSEKTHKKIKSIAAKTGQSIRKVTEDFILKGMELSDGRSSRDVVPGK